MQQQHFASAEQPLNTEWFLCYKKEDYKDYKG